ncbi:MAG TPA: hypothetical protein VN647_04000, partial [Nitrospira sp.]|nr:hypothetical protein [Nitrospira sp.]
MLVPRARTGVFAGSIAVLMVGLLILHLPTEVAKSFLSLFPRQISTPFEMENLITVAREDATAL